MAQSTTSNPEAHDYLEGISPTEQSPLDRMSGDELEAHYVELMRNVPSEMRESIETANYNPSDEFTVNRQEVFAKLCRRCLRIWNVRV